MEEWKECKLGDFIKIKHGYAFEGKSISFDDNNIVLVTPGNFAIGGGFQEKKCKFFHSSYPSEYILNENDLIVTMTDLSKDGDTLGYSAKVPYSDTRIYLHNQRIGLVQFINSEVDKDFIYWFMRSPLYQKTVLSTSSGSTVKHTSPDRICGISVKLPPLPTQQKIAAILSSLDDKIELNNKINTNLEQQAQALFKNWFIDFEPFGGKMPEGWQVGKLSDIADYYNGYAFSSKELLNEPVENCLDVFKQGHIKKGGGFIPDGTKSWYPLSKCQKLKNYILKKGDILMAMTDMKGNVAILGNTAIMPVDDKYIVNQRVGLLRAKKDLNIDYPYLYLLTNDHDFLMDLRSRANSGVQVNLSSTAIKESEVNIAPKEIYKHFNDVVLPLFEKILANQQENQKLVNIRNTLLPKLLNGEIEI